jgi:BirA family biotin operon repressor/biotin-[acetyl-CoA-carboxylase] ligase
MGTRESVLAALEARRGEYISGAALADTLSLTRNAVWKAIAALRAEGFAIDAATNRGYRLRETGGRITERSLRRYFGGAPLDIHAHRTLDSTNSAARALAESGAKELTLVVAEEQSAGRGRQGRAFYSPGGTGVYFSVILRPAVTADRAALITTAAAVAVAGAIEEITGRRAGIKWVNDVFVDGKKVCGILTEAALDMESGGVEYAVLGVGVNISPPEGGFPPELDGAAGAIFGGEPVPDARERVVAATLLRFLAFYKNLTDKTFLDEYRARSVVLGRDVIVNPEGKAERARAVEIDDELRLVVVTDGGARRALSSGEVRIRVTE